MSYMVYQTFKPRHFQWPWTTPNPYFKVRPFFDAEYLWNGYWYGHTVSWCPQSSVCIMDLPGRWIHVGTGMDSPAPHGQHIGLWPSWLVDGHHCLWPAWLTVWASQCWHAARDRQRDGQGENNAPHTGIACKDIKTRPARWALAFLVHVMLSLLCLLRYCNDLWWWRWSLTVRSSLKAT